MALLRPIALVGRGLWRWRWMSILLLASAAKLPAQTAISTEYQIKAVFLYNFARFVDWPAKVFPDSSAPVVIGVLGDDPFGSYLDETVRGEKVNGHALNVQRYRRVSDIKSCQVLFIGRSENGRLDQIVASLRGRSILTVGETDDFTARGGMIRLATENNKVRMRINLEVVKAANLRISSKLLSVAEIEH
jgi:hypothetical protein